MMAQAGPLLLLLLWQLMGSQGQVAQMKYQEGQTLRVSCSYSPQSPENRWKTWCKLRDDGERCDRLIVRKPNFPELHWDRRASLEDDTYAGTITITMSHLTVEDSGSYWCGISDSLPINFDVIRTIRLEVSPVTVLKTTRHPQTTTETPVSTPATPLINSSPSHSSIFSKYPVIQVLCGLIVTKGLVFTALVVLLGRCRAQGKEGANLSLLMIKMA